jgi:MtN3 and saliva related transmembrane protein
LSGGDLRRLEIEERAISMDWEMVGYAAAALTMFGFLPQLVKMMRTRSVDDVSLLMMVQMGVGVALWLVYGLHLNNSPLIVANVVSLSILALGIGVYFRYTTRRYFK